MRRWAWILAVIFLILCRGAGETKLEQVHPAELIYLYVDEDLVILETDTGDRGEGRTAEAAIKNLEETTAGVLLLDTADYVVAAENAEVHLKKVQKMLRPAVELCFAAEKIQVETASAYLRQHPPGLTLMDYETEREKPKVLWYQEGRYCYGTESERTAGAVVETRRSGGSGNLSGSTLQFDDSDSGRDPVPVVSDAKTEREQRARNPLMAGVVCDCSSGGRESEYHRGDVAGSSRGEMGLLDSLGPGSTDELEGKRSDYSGLYRAFLGYSNSPGKRTDFCNPGSKEMEWEEAGMG